MRQKASAVTVSFQLTVGAPSHLSQCSVVRRKKLTMRMNRTVNVSKERK